MPTIITEVGTADCRKSAIEVFAELAPGAGILREVDTTAWVGEILNASAKGVFFGIRFIMPTSHTLSDWTLRNCRTNTARGKASPHGMQIWPSLATRDIAQMRETAPAE